MVWRLVSYTTVLIPPEPYKAMYAAGIVENDKGERRVARIPAEYVDVLGMGMRGELRREESVFGEIWVFIPEAEPQQPRVVVVTGGAGGIGSEIARVFAEHGFKVALADINLEAAERVAGEIRSRGGIAVAVEMDVTSPESVSEGFSKIYSSLGRIKVLVNNAGVTIDSTLEKMTPEKWRKVIDVNLTGAYLCSREALKYMAYGGVIVNISSLIGLSGNIGQSNYAAAKSGLAGLTYSLAKELARRGIRVFAVAPGLVESGPTLKLWKHNRSLIADYVARLPIPRLIKPREVAELIYFLASNEAINGVVIPIDLGARIEPPRA